MRTGSVRATAHSIVTGGDQDLDTSLDQGVRERSKVRGAGSGPHPAVEGPAHPSNGPARQLNATWRVVVDPLQWRLQQAKGKPRTKNSGWRDRSFYAGWTDPLRARALRQRRARGVRQARCPTRTSLVAEHEDRGSRISSAVAILTASSSRKFVRAWTSGCSGTASCSQEHGRVSANLEGNRMLCIAICSSICRWVFARGRSCVRSKRRFHVS